MTKLDEHRLLEQERNIAILTVEKLKQETIIAQAEDFEKFTKSQGIRLEFCGIQTPNDKPYGESFFGCYKREEVYRNVYEDFFQAYEGWESYRKCYDELGPHGALKDMTPKAFRESKLSTVLT